MAGYDTIDARAGRTVGPKGGRAGYAGKPPTKVFEPPLTLGNSELECLQ